jgi:hypothetical protein
MAGRRRSDRALRAKLGSPGRPGAAGLLTVVFTGLPRIAPASPICFISRAVVQRATATPSRRNCRQTLRTP